MADGLAECDENGIQFLPIPLGQYSPQGKFALVRVFRSDQSPPVRDPMHMGIHTDTVLVETPGQYEVRCFPSHPLELKQSFQRIGHQSIVLVDQFPAEVPDRFRFYPVKTDRIDRFFYCGDRQFCQS